MTRVLVAGVGNIFFGDDAFGVELVRALGPVAPTVRVADFGTRALHLAYELLEPWSLCIIVDCMPRGGRPGTLYVLEPELDAADGTIPDAHGLTLPAVFAAVRELGGATPRLLVLGCEPEALDAGIGLSTSVAEAVPTAAAIVRRLIDENKEDSHEEVDDRAR